MNDKAKKSKLMGFKFDKSNVLNEIIRLETVCNRYQSFYKGYLPIDSYYDEMLAELEEAGIETVIKEVEVQLAEFQRKNAG